MEKYINEKGEIQYFIGAVPKNYTKMTISELEQEKIFTEKIDKLEEGFRQLPSGIQTFFSANYLKTKMLLNNKKKDEAIQEMQDIAIIISLFPAEYQKAYQELLSGIEKF